MKVILNQTVPKVGKSGSVVTVADGFARNFLFPKGLAIVADKRQLAALEKRQATLAAKTADKKAAAEALKIRIDGQTVKIEAKLGADGFRLVGSVTSQIVTDALNAAFGTNFDKKQVGLVDPIKRLGNYAIELDLHLSVDAVVNVHVFDPAHVVAEAAADVSEESAE